MTFSVANGDKYLVSPALWSHQNRPWDSFNRFGLKYSIEDTFSEQMIQRGLFNLTIHLPAIVNNLIDT